MAAQYLGAFLACLVLWGNYADAIAMVSEGDNTEGDNTVQLTAGIFASYPTYSTDHVRLALHCTALHS
jgi:hypothetical protein